MSTTPTHSAVLADRYVLGEQLGVGGMATVYRGEDRRLGRTVAIKVLDPRFDVDGRAAEHVDREARRAATLNHPRIVQVHDAGSEDDQAYIVMEYVSGPTLAETISEQGQLPEGQASRIVQDLCDALSAAHAQGLTHRDIKPANVLLDGDGRAKLTDFGIARRRDGDTVTREAAFGSAPYVAPEQLTGEEVDERADLYSCGVVLYEMLTGERPFQGDGIAQTAWLRVHTDPTPPSEVVDITPELEAVVLRALARDPEDRFQTAGEFAAALEGASEPLTTRLPVMTAPTSRRWRSLAGIGASLLAAIIVGLVAWGPTGSSPESVTVPDVSDMTLDAATRVLREQDLAVGEVSRGGSTLPEGMVLGQSPSVGGVVDPGSAVDLLVSSGPLEEPPPQEPEPSPSPEPAAEAEPAEASQPQPEEVAPPVEEPVDKTVGPAAERLPPGQGGAPPGKAKGRD